MTALTTDLARDEDRARHEDRARAMTDAELRREIDRHDGRRAKYRTKVTEAEAHRISAIRRELKRRRKGAT